MSKEKPATYIPSSELYEELFERTPNTPYKRAMMQATRDGKNMLNPEQRWDKWDVTEVKKGNETLYISATYETDLWKCEFKLPAIQTVSGSNLGMMKISLLILKKAFEAATTKNGKVIKEEITLIPFELVERGIAADVKYSKKLLRDWNENIRPLFNIQYCQKMREKKGQKELDIEIKKGGDLFDESLIEKTNGYLVLKMNTRLDWRFLTLYFSILPLWAWKLKSINAFSLVDMIFEYARFQKQKQNATGHLTFKIPYNRIASRLKLPVGQKTTKTGKRNGKHYEYTVGAIEKAVDEIEETSGRSEAFQLSPVHVGKTVEDIFRSGYLKIDMRGDYAIEFLKHQKKQSDIKETNMKRAIANREKAIREHIKEQLKSTEYGQLKLGLPEE